MIKKHHPHDRAERRLLKEKKKLKHFAKEQGHGLRRQIVEEEEGRRYASSVQTGNSD